MIGLKRGVVRLCEYSESWRYEAAGAVKKLKKIFGTVAVDIRHVGSTSIRTVKAKPIIDIAVAVHELSDVLPLIPELEAAGFNHIPENDNDRQFFFSCNGKKRDYRTHYIHVVRADGSEWKNYNLFRDFLNARPDMAKRYEQEKIRLAKAFPNDRVSYTEGKSDIITFFLRKALVWSYLGKTVTVSIDRPMGYRHFKHGTELLYTVNYGFLPGVTGGDGEELDVYVLGPDRPVREFSGKVVGIIHRDDDVEDKLVAAPASMKPDQAKILEAVNFAEKYYTSHLEHLYHRSCGVIVYRMKKNLPEMLIVHEKDARAWSFPKGHVEPGETDIEAAIRELREETGLIAEIIPDYREEIFYKIPPMLEKRVSFFLGKATGTLSAQEGEITECRWVNIDTAKQLLRHKAFADIVDRTVVAISDNEKRTSHK